MLNHGHALTRTRSSAVAERPRDAYCHCRGSVRVSVTQMVLFTSS